jgi:sulfite reductase (ferredoxin)
LQAGEDDLMSAIDVDQIKAASSLLRGELAAELTRPSEPFGAGAGHLLKFHGIYQQDNRDERRQLARAKEQLKYSCMVRCSVPGGVLGRDQWMEIDRLADEVGDGALRLTTRQGLQYHFVHKGDLRGLVGSLNRRLVTTYAACGDVVRNVMVSSAPLAGRDLERLVGLGKALASRFQPASAAYWELWLDGERAASVEPELEPIYGASYLPRKFKIGIAWPGDNSIDVLSNDVGLVLASGPDGTNGAVVLVGGGLGRSHADPTTFPRLADPLAWVPDADIPEVVEAIVTLFRDEGNRSDRSHARLKYLVDEHGIGWVRSEVEQRLGRELIDPVELGEWSAGRDALGWHRQEGRDRWFLGVPVPTGRLKDTGTMKRRTAVREVLSLFSDEIRLTPHQDLLLCNIPTGAKDDVEAIFAKHGVPLAQHLRPMVLSSMACPALPTCGQALGEAERVLPEVTDLIDCLLVERGLGDLQIETRMTGCANGCSRPYVAELGIVARTKTAYDIFVGGNSSGTRLAVSLIQSVPLTKLGDVLGPILDQFAAQRNPAEGFGDWAHRIGVALLGDALPVFPSRRLPLTAAQA